MGSHTFLTSCIDGITCGGPQEQTTRIQETSAYTVLLEWYKSDGKKGSYVDKPTKYPYCNPSCCSEHCSLCILPETRTKEKEKNKVKPRTRTMSNNDVEV